MGYVVCDWCESVRCHLWFREDRRLPDLQEFHGYFFQFLLLKLYGVTRRFCPGNFLTCLSQLLWNRNICLFRFKFH